MTDVTDDWIVADNEDEDDLRPLQIADQSSPLSGTPFLQARKTYYSRQQFTLLRSLPVKHRLPSEDASLSAQATKTLNYQILLRYFLVALEYLYRSLNRAHVLCHENDELRSSGSLIGSASAIQSSALAADSIRPPTTPSAVSDLIDEVDPVFSIADRAKTRTRKTRVKKPTYVPVNHDVIELTSDSDLDELSLKPPRKRQKSQDKPVKPKPRPRPKPKPQARISPSLKVPEESIVDTQPRNTVVLPAPQEPVLPSQLSFTTSRLPSSIPALPDLSSPPSSPPQITHKRKKVSPLQRPRYFVVPEIDNSHTLEDENRDADIVTASKGNKKDTKLSSRAKRKTKGRKQADRVEPDILRTNPPRMSQLQEEEPKVTSKKKALSKPTSAAKSKSKPKAKGKRKAVLSESEHEDDGNDPPGSKLPNQSNHLPEDKDSRDDGSKDSETIVIPEVTKALHLHTL
ncbi:uncharacterized protein F5891DRAFT_1170585 [Suillus fuscotomentosus]|uniref:Uncharacterized protein n=1 Tax=Suillus fuscotomentosus TaxID=1912939 RepID=A0AAD4EFD7_9AGAM|nr:uncharacterized protein F5891DRAFT_1170585 [Suillus fuscotomentosus]KAG1905041.1 hypothetical protein F5891DRAFT_1170585 [Suillus fuscotomentosus]